MKKLILGVLLLMSTFSYGKTPHHNCEYPKWQSDLSALACNIYHESRGESLLGKMAVGFVTLNRVKSGRFPNDIKGVVYQSRQFSWFSDGESDIVYNLDDWGSCLEVAVVLMQIDRHKYKFYDTTEGSLFYHSGEDVPYWADRSHLVVTLGNHSFYRNDKKK